MNEQILIVDDTPVNLQLLVIQLSKLGYRTLVAEDGATAIQQAEQVQPDLILLDVMMPDMDGFETCRRLKLTPATREIPVIFTTALTGVRDKLRGFDVGAVDYITKPFEQEVVAARVNTHLTIARQRRELQGMLAQRERFMRIAAHDLRNPLTALLGWCELGVQMNANKEVAQALEQVSQAGYRMKAIIDDFLSLQIAQSRQEGVAEAFPLDQVVAHVIEQQGYSAKLKRIELSCHLPKAPLFAVGNVAHTHQILTNYVSNAIKYSPPQTAVSIEARLAGDRWCIRVQDQGPGVAPGERNRLFAEFSKTSNRPTAGEESIGLGLCIVKTLAEAQAGRVGADFPPEGGSVFWVEIPAAAT